MSWNKSKKSSWMKQIFICDICDYTTPTKGTMINHMNMRHKFEASECHICKKFYVNAMKLKKHLRSHFENEKYECSLCARKFNTYTVLCSHIERHHKMKKTQITSLCDFCGEEYLSKVQLENHLIRFHSGAYGCFMTDCNRRFCSQTNRKLHYLLYHRFDQNQTVFIVFFLSSSLSLLIICFSNRNFYVFNKQKRLICGHTSVSMKLVERPSKLRIAGTNTISKFT